MSGTNGHKVEVTVATAGAVALGVSIVSPADAIVAITAFFAFIGGLGMRGVLGPSG